ncbi:porin [Tenacibaculum caenipelagi]|uniref:Phosphate-selective porin O/P n=1 Tax=Tenacibaculum caenipelagi TaxID=1325435 RepID=A0A4R6TI29_9FLAO|nr:porin [Tenacibaculum caenipelagi]TDQ29751.1 phosphate-selective porin O/P [Tenacibaculum caenipelagi]
MKKIFFGLLAGASLFASAQTAQRDSIPTNPQTQQNAAQRILSSNLNQQGLTVGGYAEAHLNRATGENAKLDVHRLVMLFGYKFNERTQFVTEIEFEHVKEVYVEQAFLQYTVADNVNLRAGLMLVPMGIVNEYHEPTTFNGVERPSMDKSIIPSTWRELGLGVSGKWDAASLRYQAYMFNGFNSGTYNPDAVDVADRFTAKLGGKDGLRGGRQKGAESMMNNINFAGKLDYYGLPGLRLGLSGYFGRTQSDNAIEDMEGADVGIAMVGLDARYAYQGFTARGQFIHANISDAKEYNALYSADLGSALQGWYLEAAYNLLPIDKKQQLFAFARYEDYNTHASVAEGTVKNLKYDRDEWTFGLTYKVAPGAAFKADYQFKNNAAAGSTTTKQLNLGFGVWF